MKNVRDKVTALYVCCTILAVSTHRGALCHGRRLESTELSVFHESRDHLHRNHHHHQQPQRQRSRLPDLLKNCDGKTSTLTFGLNPHNGASGGFGDRLRGMVTVYFLALMKNASFSVDWTRPYDLKDYFSLPSCKAVSSADLSFGGRLKNIRNDVDNWKYFTHSLFLNETGDVEVHTNSFHWKEVVRNEAFRERAASLGLLDLSQAELFKMAIDRLFDAPTSVVREAFDSVKRRLAAGIHEEEPPNADLPYVGVQIRLGGRNSGPVSGWDDPSRHSLEQVHCFAEEATRLCRRMRIDSIFVTADNDEALRVFEEAVVRSSAASCASCPPPPVVVHVPGSIGHTDRSSVATGHARDVWLKSVLDWWALKHATALVVSRSAFGETAAASSDAEVAVRLKLSAEGSSKCEFEDVLDRGKDVFHWP